MAPSAGCSTSWTAPPPAWVCQPRKRLPSYSSPKAMRGILETEARLAELREQLLRAAALRGIAVLHHFLEELARAVLVAHLLVGLGEIELSRDLLPFRIGARLGREHCFLRRWRAEVEADGRKVDLGRFGGRCGTFGLLVGVQVEVEIEPAARLGDGCRSHRLRGGLVV